MTKTSLPLEESQWSQYTGVPINNFDFQSMSFPPSFLVAGNPNFGDPGC